MTTQLERDAVVEILTILKRHESTLLALTIDVQALKNTLAGAERERFLSHVDRKSEQLSGEAQDMSDYIDEIIRRVKG